MLRSLVMGWLALSLSASALHAEIEFIAGPKTVDIGDMAEIKVPDGWRFVPKSSMKEFCAATQNLYSDTQLGMLLGPDDDKNGFWALFQFDETGYIKDAASEKLDADDMWKSLVEGDKDSNEARKAQGFPASFMKEWKIKPNYNAGTQRLEWAYSFTTEGSAAETVNFNTRVLGRRGVMKVTVIPNSSLDASMPAFNDTIAGFDFKDGNRYAQFTDGDKIAKYGLAALVVGGLGAAAASSGLLGKLWKFILVGIVAIFAVIKKAFNAITGRGEDEDSGAPPTKAYTPGERVSESQPLPPDSKES